MALSTGASLVRPQAQVHDVVVIGAGIIGLAVANQFLRSTDLSVAVLDAAPTTCMGATGAGQGYIWCGHHDPEDAKWPFHRHSNQLWHAFADKVRASGSDPLSSIGWKETGSLLFTSNSDDSLALHERLHKLAASSMQVEYFDSAGVRSLEPELVLPDGGAAGLVHGDAQLDAKLAVQYIQEENRALGAPQRYQEFLGSPVVDFIWSPSEMVLQGLQTTKGDIYSKHAIVLAAGAWTADLMKVLSKRFGVPLVPAISPRKGHLLVLENTCNLQLNHGLMEFSYTVKAESEQEELAIATTATMDAAGYVVLGSSREFKGFDIAPEHDVMQQILSNAVSFLPALSRFTSSAVNARTGLRPYIRGGTPVIGPVLELPGLLLASGHEGHGLSLAWGTAEAIVDMVTGSRTSLVDFRPYLPTGRLLPA